MTERFGTYRAGAAGSTNSTTGSTFFFFGAKRQKNRSRENAFPEFLSGRSEFGQTQKIMRNISDFFGLVMAFSGILDKNHWFKYQKIRLRRFVSINDQEFVEDGVTDTKIYIVVPRKTKQGKGKRKNERKKARKKINAESKLFSGPAKASGPSAKRERRASGW